MKNKKRNIIIWLMTWAVLFLVVAYSPIGRPDLYVGTSYYISNQGVSFKGGIANAPKGMAYATEEEESEIEDYAPTPDYNANNSGNASEYSPQNTNSGATNYSSASGSNQGSGQSGSVILAGNSSKGSAQGRATAQSNDASSLSSDLTLTSSASTDRQAAKPDKKDGGNDPGRHHPNPVPIGDGFWVLLLIASAFAIWKKQRATRVNTTIHK